MHALHMPDGYIISEWVRKKQSIRQDSYIEATQLWLMFLSSEQSSLIGLDSKSEVLCFLVILLLFRQIAWSVMLDYLHIIELPIVGCIKFCSTNSLFIMETYK